MSVVNLFLNKSIFDYADKKLFDSLNLLSTAVCRFTSALIAIVNLVCFVFILNLYTFID